ncbi:MAG: hypothetical protein IKN27_06415 [Selenomonadaceae bacterium]|nr:hypothetical protein [Selenomonadaceae bacterium]
MGKSFKENLMTANVVEDAQKIVPQLDRRRLEVNKIERILADKLDIIFELSTDEDVYNALKSLKGQNLREAFKACVENFGFTCDPALLNRLNPARTLALFFHVFAVYPEAIPSIGTKTQLEFDAELFAEIFPNFTDAGEVEFSAVAKFLPKEFQNVSSTEELKQTLSAEKIPQGTIVREFIEKTIETAGLDFDKQKFTAVNREEYLPLFFHAINFKFSAKPAEIPPQPKPTEEPQEILNLSFGQVQAIFDAAQKVSVDDSDFDISDTLKLFEKNSVTVKDKLYLSIPDDKKIFYGLTAIATLDGQIAAVGRIEDNVVEERGVQKFPHMIFDWEKINPEKFINRKNFQAVLVPLAAKNFFDRPMSQSLAESFDGELWTLEFDVVYRPLEVTDKPLCIDFGTSNTTAGTFNAEKGGIPEQVTFRDVTSDEVVFSEVLPTIVYVDSCIDNKVTFKHGYEAKKKVIEAGYNTKATVFYEIKRWINSLEEIEEVTDGIETARITRREILGDYLRHVIKAAEEQFRVKFKKLHMTSPVKLKKKFLDEMEKIFAPDYVVDKDSLDEGLATVYHYIAERIKNTGDISGKILILDCGGGTTDLASCEYFVTQGSDWATVTLQTDFESGDSNFGGNNITYRILQMLKMKIAANLERNENLPMHDLIPDENDDILSQIDYDLANREEIYSAFEREYQRVENLIPTKFASFTMKNERLKVKRNFYYLWQLAESIKIEFFKSNLVNVDLEKDKKIFVRSPDEYFLSVRREGKLQPKSDPMDGVEITIREISRILLPDLYALLKTLLAHYGDGELLNYKYRLSGQSCKINEFRDLFKEFVPGKHMRIPHARGEFTKVRSVDSVELKKYCILGSIEYVYDVKSRGKYTANIMPNKNRRIYEVKIVLDKDETVLLGRGENLGLKKFPGKTTITAEFLVRGENNRLERRFFYHFDKSDAECCSVTKLLDIMEKETIHSRNVLERELGEKLQDIELSNGQSILCFAALDSKSGYGFNIYQIWVKNDNGAINFWIPKKRHFESYEDENLQTFFNGDK